MVARDLEFGRERVAHCLEKFRFMYVLASLFLFFLSLHLAHRWHLFPQRVGGQSSCPYDLDGRGAARGPFCTEHYYNLFTNRDWLDPSEREERATALGEKKLIDVCAPEKLAGIKWTWAMDMGLV